jgi:hypothetical protein
MKISFPKLSTIARVSQAGGREGSVAIEISSRRRSSTGKEIKEERRRRGGIYRLRGREVVVTYKQGR